MCKKKQDEKMIGGGEGGGGCKKGKGLLIRFITIK